ncbi:MAG: ABC transporter substrate-binding protein [Solirubrobacterales bacterium]|nr:ABC transporter substrate-binding protein [Solirubrobacterales bacterium]MCB8969349.1 ABC transporter substrate-binding protein [Thermoleophilales bacterium]MCO5327811.1 ABC transporter substrate-binding protein [Solirubrobacterales bacterium]
MKRAAAAGSAFLALVAAALAVGACGSDAGSDDRFDLMLDYVVNPDHAGIYTATDKGYFDDEGLDVEIRLPPDPAAPIKQVAAGRVDLAISYQPEVVLAREQGLDVVAVAALVNGPLTSLISLPAAGIDDPADLEGTTVVDAGIPYQSAYLRTILDNAGVDPDTVEEVNVGFNLVPPLLSGKADAMLGGFLNVEGVQLEADGENPRVVPVDELGVPPYDELVLVADAERVRDDPGQIEDFLAALERGTEDAVADPSLATKVIVDAVDRLDPALTRKQIDATLPLLQPEDGKPFGYMDADEWQAFSDYMAEEGQVDEAPPADELMTDDLLPDR